MIEIFQVFLYDVVLEEFVFYKDYENILMIQKEFKEHDEKVRIKTQQIGMTCC